MKVLDLQCRHQHVFEGWFGSEDDFLDQLARGLVQCPLCGDAEVTKRLSAPRLNFGAQQVPGHDTKQGDGNNRNSSAAPVPASNRAEEQRKADLVTTNPADSTISPELARAWFEMAKRIVAHTDDVGDKFADEARKIHYGETEQRAIRGKASAHETRELLEEGIAVMPLPLPEALKNRLQ